MKKNLFIVFSAVILILGMLMILSSYEKVQMAGIFGKNLDEGLPLCEIIENEDELITDEPKIEKDEQKSLDEKKPVCPECDPKCPKINEEHQKCPDGCKEPHNEILPNKSQSETEKKPSAESKKKRQYKHKKRHRFFEFEKDNIQHANRYIVEEIDNLDVAFDVPFKSIRPDLKRKQPKTGGRKSPPKTLPIPIEDNRQYVSVSANDGSVINTYRAQKPKILQIVFGNVISKDSVNKLVVKGELVSGQYYENIVIEIYGMDDVLINTIRPKTNSGYDANIMLGDFVGNGLDQISLGINSGGSGGFGYFYVFDVFNNEIKTIFDYQDFSQKNKYVGRYLDYYRAEVLKTDSSSKYIIDLSGRPRDYLDMLWGADGKLLIQKSLTISDVNTVFPYYNFSTQLFELMIFQRVTGLYSADGLGYITTQQHYKDGGFVTFYETLGVFSQVNQ